ncbi:MAG: hypothetical protein ABRQ37_15155 [Candidatus Eremiobacterota bacterium]
MPDIKANHNTHGAKSVALSGSQKKISKAPEQIDTYKPGEVTPPPGTINPELIAGKTRLAEMGIKFSCPSNLMTDQDQLQLMKGLEAVVAKMPKEKRPANLPLSVEAKDPNGRAAGRYSPMLKDIVIYRFTKTDKPFPVQTMILTSVHEYGHATHDALKPDVEGESPYPPILDSKGRDITVRADTLEADATAKGHDPDNIADDATGTVWDRCDAYVESHPWMKDGAKAEKYSRKNFKEHFAETFREYIAYPQRFKDKIASMEKELKTLAPDSEEAKYVSESIDIMKESYNYYKEQIFNGYEFPTTTRSVDYRKIDPEFLQYEE